MKIFNYIFLLFTVLLFACEKVIDVDLNDINPSIVIEATLTDSPNSVKVKITKTKNYFGNESIQTVSNAVVTVEDFSGKIITVDEIQDGIYEKENLALIKGTDYKMMVEVEGVLYQSVSKLNEAVHIDTLIAVYSDGNPFLSSGYFVNIHFFDPPNIQNYYRLKIYINGEFYNESSNYILFNDKNIDGKNVEIGIRSLIFDVGDEVRYELISLDKDAYNYLSAISDITSESSAGTAAPANPDPNFSNGAIGYFSAFTLHEKIILIEE